MAVCRPEFHMDEAAEIVTLLQAQKLDRMSPLWRARREMVRSHERALEIEKREQETRARQLRNRKVPDFDETPLTPQSMSRRTRGGKSGTEQS